MDQVADLGKGEGGRGVGPDGSAEDLARVSRQPRGDVHGHNRFALGVDQVDHLCLNATHGGVEPCAEDGVDPQLRHAHGATVALEGLRVGDLDHCHAQRIEQGQVGRRIAGDPIAGGEQKDGDRMASLGQVTGHDESVTAVVAPAGGDADGPASPIAEGFQEGLDGAAASVFHQHTARQTEIFDGGPVNGLHCGGRHQLHGGCPFIFLYCYRGVAF